MRLMWMALVLLGCSSAATRPAKRGPPVPSIRHDSDSAQSGCKDCAAFCARSGCDVGNDACLERCNAVCGDGYFDDRDGALIACVIADKGDGCKALALCCQGHDENGVRHINYTSQLCTNVGIVIEPVPDAGEPDATGPDITAPDAAGPDVSAPDAGPLDATVPDATAPETKDATTPH